jgi:hypothetical protein
MNDVGLTARPKLVLVVRSGHLERVDDQLPVETGIVFVHLGKESREQLLCGRAVHRVSGGGLFGPW